MNRDGRQMEISLWIKFAEQILRDERRRGSYLGSVVHSAQAFRRDRFEKSYRFQRGLPRFMCDYVVVSDRINIIDSFEASE